jgi:hypothetical protein
MQRLFLVLVLGLFSFATQAALVEYTYTGSVFDSTADIFGTVEAYEVGVDRISGSFIIDDADMVSLGFPGGQTNVISDVVSWSFDDGASGAPWSSTINDANGGTLLSFAFHTDASGNILEWDIFIYRHPSNRWMDWCFNAGSCTDSDSVMNRAPSPQYTASTSTPGVWSAPAPIPVPPAVWLFGSALGFLGWMKRRHAV